MLSDLMGGLQMWVKDAGRDTVLRNVRRDPANPRWARVPRPAHDCRASCLIVQRFQAVRVITVNLGVCVPERGYDLAIAVVVKASARRATPGAYADGVKDRPQTT